MHIYELWSEFVQLYSQHSDTHTQTVHAVNTVTHTQTVHAVNTTHGQQQLQHVSETTPQRITIQEHNKRHGCFEGF